MWYLTRVIDSNFTRTREVVLAETYRIIVVQVGVHMRAKLVFVKNSAYKNLGDNQWWPYLLFCHVPHAYVQVVTC